MFGYKSKKVKAAELKAKRISDEIDKLAKEESNKILAEAEKIIEDKRIADEKLKEEPFLNLKGLVQQSDGKVKIELDWDDDFIQKLKQSGYTGADDNAIIQKYLLELTSLISEDMSGDSDYE